MFPSLNSGETDVFAFTAFLKPGLHSIIIYDPIEKLYFKKTIVIEVNPNEEKMVVSDHMLDELKLELRMEKQKEVNSFDAWEPDQVPLSRER